jgi:hypothetical protein
MMPRWLKPRADTYQQTAWQAQPPSGPYAFFSTAGYKRTRVNPANGDTRDTFSRWFKESLCTCEFAISDITSDDRYYFMASKCQGDMAEIHRIEMSPSDFSVAPNVPAIRFSDRALLHDETTNITDDLSLGQAVVPLLLLFERLGISTTIRNHTGIMKWCVTGGSGLRSLDAFIPSYPLLHHSITPVFQIGAKPLSSGMPARSGWVSRRPPEIGGIHIQPVLSHSCLLRCQRRHVLAAGIQQEDFVSTHRKETHTAFQPGRHLPASLRDIG